MAEDEKWVKLVAKLNAMTQDAKLVWKGPTEIDNKSARTLRDYVSNYKEVTFRLRNATGAGKPRAVYLNIVDANNYENKLFEIPDVVGLVDLADSVIYQTAGIKTLLDDLLKDD